MKTLINGEYKATSFNFLRHGRGERGRGGNGEGGKKGGVGGGARKFP